MARATRLRLWSRLGVGGAVAMYLGLATLWALAVPLFLPADETAHVDYASHVSHGHLPLAGSPLHAEFRTLGQRSGTQYVAYHPPLYYALIAPLVRLGSSSPHPRFWLLAVRGVGILLAVATVVLVAVLARRVFAHWDPARRTQLAVLAAGLVAVVPSMIGATASIQNDPLVLMLVVLAAVCLAGIVRGGVTRRRVVVLGVVCGLGMLTRVTYVQAFVTAIATVALLLVRRPGSGRDQLSLGRRLGHAVGYLAPIAAGPALIAGWYYLKNHDRYGSYTGSNVAYDLVSSRTLQPRMSGPFRFALDPHSWWAQLLQLGGAGAGLVSAPGTAPKLIAVLLTVCIVFGAIAIGLRWKSVRPDGDGWILLGGLLLVLLISFAEIATHVSHKGSENNRYLLDALPFWGIAFGVALLAIGPRRFPVLAMLVLIAEVLAAGNFILTIARRQHALLDSHGPLGALEMSMRHAGVPGPRAVLGVVLTVILVGLLAQCAALSALAGRRPDAPASREAPQRLAVGDSMQAGLSGPHNSAEANGGAGPESGR